MGQKWAAGKGAYTVHYAEYSVTGRRLEMEDAFIADVQFGKSFPNAAKEKGTPDAYLSYNHFAIFRVYGCP